VDPDVFQVKDSGPQRVPGGPLDAEALRFAAEEASQFPVPKDPVADQKVEALETAQKHEAPKGRLPVFPHVTRGVTPVFLAFCPMDLPAVTCPPSLRAPASCQSKPLYPDLITRTAKIMQDLPPISPKMSSCFGRVPEGKGGLLMKEDEMVEITDPGLTHPRDILHRPKRNEMLRRTFSV
jgi:hypothetical protein